jgi:LuxR family maltose regulon positive regulatory protein
MLVTKLNRPAITDEIVFRQEAIEALELGVIKPLTLVSAPAGYGKSTLISTWLEQKKHKYAWISLGKSENELNGFINYLYHSLQLVFTNNFEKLNEYVLASEIDSVLNLSHELINEIEAIEEEFILVLDDFHLIDNQNIIALINDLLAFPPEGFHLVIITRVDPPINISNLRAHSRLSEVRMTHLAFTEKETKELLANKGGLKADDETIANLCSSTEGWITGLHLYLLAYQQGLDDNKKIEKLTPNTIWISDFLYQEVFLKQEKFVQQALIYSALFNRFCAPLLDAIIQDPTQKSDQVIVKLRKANLFLINLDQESKWYRYHHLFNDLLLEIKDKLISKEQERDIMIGAAHWFESEGLLDESVECFIKSNANLEVVRIIDENYSELFTNGDLNVVQRWIDQLPEDIRRNNTVVLMIKAWIAYGSFKIELIPALIEKIEAEIKNHPQNSIVQEVNFMKGNISYWSGDAETAAEYLDEVRENTKGLYTHLTSNTVTIWAIANHSLGNEELIKAELHADLENCPPTDLSRQGYIHAALAFESLLSGNLEDAKTAGYRMKNVTDIHPNANIKAWKNYILGCTHIQELNTEKSIEQFASAARHKLLLDQRAVVDALAMVALSNRI